MAQEQKEEQRSGETQARARVGLAPAVSDKDSKMMNRVDPRLPHDSGLEHDFTPLRGRLQRGPTVKFSERVGRQAETEPERTLLAAVLRNAVHCLQKYRSARHIRGRRLFWQEYQWFMREQPAGGMQRGVSFTFVCDALGLDAGHIRASLRRWCR